MCSYVCGARHQLFRPHRAHMESDGEKAARRFECDMTQQVKPLSSAEVADNAAENREAPKTVEKGLKWRRRRLRCRAGSARIIN
jgi:hypothetical protein